MTDLDSRWQTEPVLIATSAKVVRVLPAAILLVDAYLSRYDSICKKRLIAV